MPEQRKQCFFLLGFFNNAEAYLPYSINILITSIVNWNRNLELTPFGELDWANVHMKSIIVHCNSYMLGYLCQQSPSPHFEH